jgi:hypothetical protein
MEKIRLMPFPSNVRASRPGPSITTSLVMAISPLVSVIVAGVGMLKLMVSSPAWLLARVIASRRLQSPACSQHFGHPDE